MLYLLVVHHPLAAYCTEGRMYALRNWQSHNWCASKKTAPWCFCADRIYLDQTVLMPPLLACWTQRKASAINKKTIRRFLLLQNYSRKNFSPRSWFETESLLTEGFFWQNFCCADLEASWPSSPCDSFFILVFGWWAPMLQFLFHERTALMVT